MVSCRGLSDEERRQRLESVRRRLAEIDQWAFELAHEFAPKKDAKGKTCWENPGDEARFERFLMGGAHNPR